MKVASDGFFDIYVYSGELMGKHHLPHCHVLSPDGDSVVVLPTLNVIVGKPLSKRIRELLLNNLDKILNEWNGKNPKREI